ncbi:MAG: patatin-like phospholipase family protein [Hyphomicrobiaceae bacterium]
MADETQGQSRLLDFILEIRRASYTQRSTILIAAFAAAALALPPATREAYRILADDAHRLWPQIGFAFATLLIAACVTWYVGRDLACQIHGQIHGKEAGGPKAFLLRSLPVLGAMALPLAAAWGVYQASLDSVQISTLGTVLPSPLDPEYPSPMTATQVQLRSVLGEMDAVAKLLLAGAYVCVGLAVALGIGLSLIDWRRKGAPFAASTRYLLLLIAVIVVALFSLTLIELPRQLGTVALFNIFIAVLVLFVGRCVYINDRFGIPVVMLAILAALVFSIFDLNDNHVVRTIQSKNSAVGKSTDTEFRKWLAARADRAAYQSEPYPVFVVAAAGGGLYAAEYTARFLARIQDHCPHFAQHIFAISGVSGGSIGAAVFAGLLNRPGVQQTDRPGCRAFGPDVGPLEKDVEAILGKDYLSPIVAATLFPDFLQRFLPFPVESFDRGKVLDTALEAAWRDLHPKGASNPFQMSLQDLWDPKGVAPALVLNATHVATGGRFAMAPFYPRRWDQGAVKLEWLQGHLQNGAIGTKKSSGLEDLKLSSSAGISARFPWIMPAATIHAPKQNADRKNTILRLVDGGYFENSGTETLGDLVRGMRIDKINEAKTNVKLYTIVLTGYEDELFGGNFNDETPLGEFVAPIRGLLSTRQARGDLTIVRTLDFLCPDLDNCNTVPDDRGWHNKALWVFATLNLKDSQLPLSWHLSESSRRFIGLHAGTPGDCGNAFHGVVPVWTGLEPVLAKPPLPGMAQKPPRLLAALNNTNCAASIICARLADKKLAFPPATGSMENYCKAWESSSLESAGVRN